MYYQGKPLGGVIRLAITLIIFGLVIWFIPEPAFADFDLQKGADSALSLIKTILLIAMIAAALVLFMRHQLMAALVVVIVGAIVLAAASPATLEALGKGILNLLGGP